MEKELYMADGVGALWFADLELLLLAHVQTPAS